MPQDNELLRRLLSQLQTPQEEKSHDAGAVIEEELSETAKREMLARQAMAVTAGSGVMSKITGTPRAPGVISSTGITGGIGTSDSITPSGGYGNQGAGGSGGMRGGGGSFGGGGGGGEWSGGGAQQQMGARARTPWHDTHLAFGSGGRGRTPWHSSHPGISSGQTSIGSGGGDYSGAGSGGAGGSTIGWWTPERQRYAINYMMKNAHLSEMGARGLVSRWANVEAAGGPSEVNKIGATGIAQWLGARKAGIKVGDFEGQLAHAASELNTSEKSAGDALRSAKSAQEAARGASMYERAEGYNSRTGLDNWTNKTLMGIPRISGGAPSGGSGGGGGGGGEAPGGGRGGGFGAGTTSSAGGGGGGGAGTGGAISAQATGSHDQVRGTMVVNGHVYPFVSGGRGRGAAPYGEYSVGGLSSLPSYGIPGYPMSSKYDPVIKDTRSGLFIHPGGNASAGCLAIPKNRWAAFEADMKADGRHKLVLSPDGKRHDEGAQSADPSSKRGEPEPSFEQRVQVAQSGKPARISPRSAQQTSSEILFGKPETSIVKTKAAMGSGYGLGTGFSIGGGYFMTARHNIGDAKNIGITYGKETAQAELVHKNPALDYAIFKVPPETASRFAASGMTSMHLSSKTPTRGDILTAHGFPGDKTGRAQEGYSSTSGQYSRLIGGGVLQIGKGTGLAPIYTITSKDPREGVSGGPITDKEGAATGLLTGYDKPSRTMASPPMSQILKNIPKKAIPQNILDAAENENAQRRQDPDRKVEEQQHGGTPERTTPTPEQPPGRWNRSWHSITGQETPQQREQYNRDRDTQQQRAPEQHPGRWNRGEQPGEAPRGGTTPPTQDRTEQQHPGGGEQRTGGAGRVFEDQGRAGTRKGKITSELRRQLEYAGEKTGLNFHIFSGGQRMEGAPGHTGSHRHDQGQSADGYFTDKSGRRLNASNPEDRKQISAYISHAVAAGATGIGAGPGYMEGHGGTAVHIGGGSHLTWGAGGASQNAPGWLREAYAEGGKLRAGGEGGKPGPGPAERSGPGPGERPRAGRPHHDGRPHVTHHGRPHARPHTTHRRPHRTEHAHHGPQHPHRRHHPSGHPGGGGGHVGGRPEDVQILPGDSTEVRMVKQFEAFSATPYPDKGQTSIGYGSKAREGEKSITQEEASKRIGEEFGEINTWLNSNVTAKMTKNQRAGLVSFAYNEGVGALDRLKNDINSGNWNQVYKRMATWNKITENGQKVFSKGIYARRKREIELMATPDGALPKDFNFKEKSFGTMGLPGAAKIKELGLPHDTDPAAKEGPQPVSRAERAGKRMLFAHGIQGRYGDVSPEQVEGYARDIAQSRGYKDISTLYEKDIDAGKKGKETGEQRRARQSANVMRALEEREDVTGVLGFSKGGNVLRNALQSKDVPESVKKRIREAFIVGSPETKGRIPDVYMRDIPHLKDVEHMHMLEQLAKRRTLADPDHPDHPKESTQRAPDSRSFSEYYKRNRQAQDSALKHSALPNHQQSASAPADTANKNPTVRSTAQAYTHYQQEKRNTNQTANWTQHHPSTAASSRVESAYVKPKTGRDESFATAGLSNA